jgi:glutaminyl-peptide cyclotransferase
MAAFAVAAAVAGWDRPEAQAQSQRPVAESAPASGSSPARDPVATTPGATQGKPQPGNPLNAGRAYGYLQEICALGPRISGSPGMMQQVRLVRQHFAKLGGNVRFQQFTAEDPRGGQNVPMVNMIVEWHPEKKERILLCAHYDTRPLPDRDPDPTNRRQGTFIGASDGASGVAALMELAHRMPELDIRYGVDFVLFDGEEFVYSERDRYFLGSEHFARQYAKEPPAHKYRWGVLLDMIGDADLQIYHEWHSVAWRDTRPLVAQIWGTAQRLGVREFVAHTRHKVQDDHIPLRQVAKIPTCNIIDLDYPAWHTTADVPQNCSGESLAKVGWVVLEWLKMQTPGEPRAESQESRARGS